MADVVRETRSLLVRPEMIPLLHGISLRVWRAGLGGEELRREVLARVALASRWWVLRRVVEICSFAARQVERGGYSSRMKGLAADLLRRMGLRRRAGMVWKARLHGKSSARRAEGVVLFMLALRDALAEYAVRERMSEERAGAYTLVEHELRGFVVSYAGVIPAPKTRVYAHIMRDKMAGVILDYGRLAPILQPGTTVTVWHPKHGHARATISTPLVADFASTG